MAILRFFKLPKNQNFTYQPRYWDPEKEDLEERLRLAKEGNAGNVEAIKTRLSKGFRNGSTNFTGSTGYRRKQAKRSNITLLAIIILLVFITYLLLTVYLPEFIKAFELGGSELDSLQ